MNCGYCGTELPDTALFCGECGRSLAPSKRPAAATAVAVASPTADTSILDRRELDVLSEIDGATEVTWSRKKTAVVEITAPEPEPVEPIETPEPASELVEPPAPEVEAPEPERIEPVEAPAPVEVQELPRPPAPDPWTPPARLLRSAPDLSLEHDLEKTRIVSNTQTGPRFVLQFSTGESVTIFGNGLIGRNPTPEPSEYFDHLVAIVDPGKSVSKTHLEFGQAAGMFWVSDRFSGNGTVIREPDAAPRRCDPSKRYRIARGTRVTMGEQFFVVS